MLLEKADGEDLRSLRDLAMLSVLLGCGSQRAGVSWTGPQNPLMNGREGAWSSSKLL